MSIDVTSLYNRRADNRWDRTCVGDILERLTWSRPDKIAITGWTGAFGEPAYERLTYRQADEIANRFARGLLARGLSRGDRVMLICENSVEAYLAKFATAKAGLVAVPVNPSLAPDVLAHLVRLAGPRFVIVDAELWPAVADVIGSAGLRPDVTIPIGGGVAPGGVSFTQFMADQPATEPDAVVHGDDIWEILFTSGTTAMPKGVMLSHSYAYMGALSFALSLTRGVAIESDLKLCSFLPVIYHVADEVLSLPAFLAGGSLVIGRKPVPGEMAAAIARERVTALWGGSPQLVKALAAALDTAANGPDTAATGPDATATGSYAPPAGRPDARSLQVVVYGWGAVEPAVRTRLQDLCGDRFILVGIFGQTEAISCHRFWPDAWEETYLATAPQLNYVGIPNPLLGSTVMDADGGQLLDQPGVPGEAVYRSPAVTSGYYQDEAATRQAFRHGWFHSGDSCMVDSGGLRIMVDRYKDIIKSGGENVSSLRVEAILHQHPGVAKAAVVGLAHDRWGEAVTAIVVPVPGAQPTEAELVAFCRERLAGFESPKAVITAASLPETVGGKVLKYKLREEFADHFQRAGTRPESLPASSTLTT